MADKKAPRELMKNWPKSWAGFDADVAVGQRIVDELVPFVTHLERSGLTRKTIQRHISWLWTIGGEIIRDVNDEEHRRRWSGRKLIDAAVQYGESPLIRGADEDEQARADSTARKLRKFLMS